MIWLGHSFYKHLCNLQADLRVTLDCWISYLIYSHREKEAHQLPWACEIQNPQRQSYYCSEAVSMVVSFFRARALSFRVSSGFFFFFFHLLHLCFPLQGKCFRSQMTAIARGRALRWELEGITIIHQLQSLNHPRHHDFVHFPSSAS